MAEEPRPGEEGLSPNARALRRAQPYIDAVWKFTGGAGVGVLAGVFLDRWLHSSPAFTLGLLMLGMGVGFWGMYRAITKASSSGGTK